jgi:hypothetical protein
LEVGQPLCLRGSSESLQSADKQLGIDERPGERFSWYGCNDLRAKIESPSGCQYKAGNFLAGRPLNWDETIDENDDDENWANPGLPSIRRSCSGDGNYNDNGKCEEDMQGSEIGTGKWKGTKNGMGKGKGKGKGNGNRKRIVK